MACVGGGSTKHGEAAWRQGESMVERRGGGVEPMRVGLVVSAGSR